MEKLKKRMRQLLTGYFVLCLLSGCAGADSYMESGEQLLEELLSANEKTQVAPVQETILQKPLVEEFTTDVYYYYHTLSPEQQTLYREIYEILSGCMEETTVSTLKEEELKQVFELVLLDHPELFYVEGYQYTRYYLGDLLSRLSLKGSYSMEKEEILSCWSQIEAITDEIVTQVSEYTDEYEKAKFLYEYLIRETEYEVDAWNNQNICSVFLNKASVCQGYAKAYQFLGQKCGLKSALVSGVANGEGHAWNLVQINGAFYYVDPTWGDASYVMNGDASFVDGINYDFFLVTTKEMQENHVPELAHLLPDCVETKDNYYVREQLFLTTWDYEMVTQIIGNAKSKGQNYVTLKCADAGTFDAVVDALIENQRIFEIIGYSEEGVAYAYDDKQYTFSVWF